MRKPNDYLIRIVALTIIAAPLFYLGIGAKYPWVLFGKYGISLGIVIFFTSSLLFWLLVIFPIKLVNGRLLITRSMLIRRNVLVIIVFFSINSFISSLFILLYDYIQYKHFRQYGYNQPYLLYLSDLGLILVSLSFLKLNLVTNKRNFLKLNFLTNKIKVLKSNNNSNNNNKLKSYFIIAILFNLIHQLLSIHYFPLTSARSDMLSAINVALDQFRHGLSPYAKVISNIGVAPYLPLTILSFYPGNILKIDFRLIGLIYWSLTLLCLYLKFDHLIKSSQMALCLLILNPYWLMRHDLYFQLFLLELVILFLYASSLNIILRTIIVALTITTLQFAWLLIPFILFAYCKDPAQFIKELLISLIIALIITLLFIHHHYQDFINAIFLHKEYKTPYRSDITFGLASIFYFAKNQYLLYLIQLTGSVIIISYASYQFIIKKMRDSYFYLSLSAICYLFFMASNYFIETYLFMPALLTLTLPSNNHNNHSNLSINHNSPSKSYNSPAPNLNSNINNDASPTY